MPRTVPEDTTEACRSAARHMLADLREHVRVAGQPDTVTVPDLVRRVVAMVESKAGEWPTPGGRLRFLAEMAAEASAELMVQPDDGGTGSQFYSQLRDRIYDLHRA